MVYFGQLSTSWSQLCFLLIVGALVLLLINNWFQRFKLDDRVREKRLEISSGINYVRQRVQSSCYSSDQLLKIASTSLEQLKRDLRSGLLRPVDILHAFQHRALLLYDAGNSGIYQFLVEAEETARSLESKLNRLLDKHPLAGIPISVKEACAIKGYDTTFGLAKRCGHPNPADCIVIQALKACGAVPFALTSGMLSGTEPIFGNLGNPHNLSHWPGGSSTGECVLHAQGGSLIGITNDSLGSSRMPATFCGVAALRVSESRLSCRGFGHVLTSTTLGIETVIGLIGSKIDVLVELIRTLLIDKLFDLDHHVLPLPFNEVMFNDRSKLTIGVYYTLEHKKLTQSTPAVHRAIQKSVDILQHLGHQTVPFTPPRFTHARRLFYQCLFAGGGQELVEELSYEALDGRSLPLRLLTSLPIPIVRAGSLLLNALNDVKRGNLCKGPDVFELMQQVSEYRKEFAEAWYDAEIDALICPCLPVPAIPKSMNPKLIANAVIHPGLYSLVDYSTGVLPVGFVEKGVGQEVSSDDLPFCQLDQLCAGLPLAIQIVAPPCREELLLRVMHEIEGANG